MSAISQWMIAPCTTVLSAEDRDFEVTDASVTSQDATVYYDSLSSGIISRDDFWKQVLMQL